MRKHSRFYTDKQGRVRYMGKDGVKQPQSTSRISDIEVAPQRKALQFITNEEGQVIPIGGPGSGAGGASGATNNSVINFNDTSSAEEWGNQAFLDWKKGLTSQEKILIEAYSGNAYEQLNEYMRNGEVPDIEWGDATLYTLGKRETVDDILSGRVSVRKLANEYANKMTVALERSEVPQSVMVYRGFGEGGLLKSLTPGDSFLDKAPVSTSLLESEALGFTTRNGVLARVLVPRGSRGAFLGNLAGRELAHECELLLAPNTRYRVVGKQSRDGLTVVDLEVVND